VSNEASGLLENHIEKKGIAYPIAKTKGEDIDRMYGVKGFPSGALVDAQGRVVWTGHPGSVPHATLEELLAQTAFVPPVEGDDYKKINKLIADQDLGKAMAAIKKELERSPEDSALAKTQADIESLITRKLEYAKQANEAHDYARAVEVYEEAQSLFKGLDAADQAKELQKAIEKDPAAKDELSAWSKMIKGDEAQAAGDFEKAAKIYKGIVKKYPETRCAERAQAFLGRHASL
jgi:tetratricopeptide (TPR) repeat protein